MYQIRHNDLNALIKQYYNRKLALFVFGAFGIGKSFLIRDTSIEISKQEGKEFVDWNKISKAKKKEIAENPEGYFVFIDIRLSEYDAGDMKLPNLKQETDTFDWKIPLWAKVLTNPKSQGVLFLDEFNLASRLVIASVYKIIYDRVVEEHSISEGWGIFGAGNRETDKAYVQTLPSPVRDRGGEVELLNPTIKDFTDWASRNNIDGRVIGFLNFSSECLYDVKDDDKQKHTTPRGWERVSELIQGVKDYNLMEKLCSSAIGEGIAKKFVSFCRIEERQNMKDYVNNPEKIRDIEKFDVKYFLITSLAEMYRDNKVDITKIFDVSDILKEDKVEYVTLLWRLCKRYTVDSGKFSRDFSNSDSERTKEYEDYLQ